MSDLIVCPKCGKETNQYSPSCEHCRAPLLRGASTLAGASGPESATIAQPARTIDERGKALGEALAAHSVHFMKKCPFCAEEIRSDAIKCRYCGERLAKPHNAVKRYATMLVTALACAAALFALILKFGGAGAIMSFTKTHALSGELKADPSKAEYVKKYIILSDIGTLTEVDSKYNTSKDYISGTVRNTGGRLVIKLKLTVYYLDKQGAVMAEGAVWPVLGNKDKPDSLKASASKDFKLDITNVNPAWSRAVRVKVADIEFLE